LSLKFALLVTASLASGCSLFAHKGPSVVARGEYYAAGKPEYDAFFITLHDKQVQLLAAPEEPKSARKNLALAVGLSADASNESLKERLAEELTKLAGQGLKVRLEAPEPSAALDASATFYASETATSTPLRSLLPEEATRLVRSRNRMLVNRTELDKLRVTGITLDTNIDQAFRVDGPWKRDEVRKNLTDGQKVITLMQSRAREIADDDTLLLGVLTAVASTGPASGKAAPYTPPAPPAEETAKPGKRPAPPRASGSAPAHAPTPAKAAPPPASKPAGKRGGDDDNASAPKPTQGNAPAEIEP
jgi:hypothetical protein